MFNRSSTQQEISWQNRLLQQTVSFESSSDAKQHQQTPRYKNRNSHNNNANSPCGFVWLSFCSAVQVLWWMATFIFWAWIHARLWCPLGMGGTRHVDTVGLNQNLNKQGCVICICGWAFCWEFPERRTADTAQGWKHYFMLFMLFLLQLLWDPCIKTSHGSEDNLLSEQETFTHPLF